MTTRLLLVLAWTLAAALTLAAAATAAPDNRSSKERNAPRATLTPFRSDAELLRYLKRVRRLPPAPVPVPPVPLAPQPSQPQPSLPSTTPPPPPPPPPASAPAIPAVPLSPRAASEAEPAKVKVPDENITNTQEADVDEGGIVKMHGNKLVILRRGRLFTVSTADGELRPIDSIDAYPPGVDARGDWYDEMLVSGDRVIVIGYSYGRGGTEINRFRIDADGRLKFEDAYHLRSNDYYSSRNYASRLIGTKLIFYSPLYLPYQDYVVALPAMRRWNGDAKAKFKRIVGARQIYLPRPWRNYDAEMEALHTVTACDLTAPDLQCTGTSVLGPNGRTFYVSSHAVYVWVTENAWTRPDKDKRPLLSLLYRLPLDGSAPSAIGVHGAPIDQFSFREDWQDGRLNVLVRSEGGGDAMWRPEFSEGDVALLRLPLDRFGTGAENAARRYYRDLPNPDKDSYSLQNRFIGDYILYGAGNSWGPPDKNTSHVVVVAVRWHGVTRIPLAHGVDRIEAMGRDAVVVGVGEKGLHFQAVELTTDKGPTLGDRYTLTEAAQGETRSHAFFFKPEPRLEERDTTAGVMALPIARRGRPAYYQLTDTSAAMLFLRRLNRKFAPLGELKARDDILVDDGCKASCVDWYGNARPIFLSKRTFALMGYELVEGELQPSSIREIRRINFAPPRR